MKGGAFSDVGNGNLNNKADLVDGKVPASQLPSFVDDVLEGTYVDNTTFNNNEGEVYTPESGKIYVDISTNKSYRWTGSIYTEVSPESILVATEKVIIDTTDWSGSSAPYIKTVGVKGLIADDSPIISLVISSDTEIASQEEDEYSKIIKIDTLDDNIKIYATEPITRNITLILKVIRNNASLKSGTSKDAIIEKLQKDNKRLQGALAFLFLDSSYIKNFVNQPSFESDDKFNIEYLIGYFADLVTNNIIPLDDFNDSMKEFIQEYIETGTITIPNHEDEPI